MQCANGHAPIEHDEFYCPLCAEIEDRRADEDRSASLEVEIEDLKELIADSKAADLAALRADVESANHAEYIARMRFNRIETAIVCGRTSQPIGKHLTRIKLALAEAKTL